MEEDEQIDQTEEFVEETQEVDQDESVQDEPVEEIESEDQTLNEAVENPIDIDQAETPDLEKEATSPLDVNQTSNSHFSLGATEPKSSFSFEGDGIDEARQEFNNEAETFKEELNEALGELDPDGLDALSETVENFSEKIDNFSEEAASESPEVSSSTEPTTAEKSVGKWEVTETKDGKVRAFVGNDRDPQDPEAPKLGNWDLNIPGMKVQARSNDHKNDMELIWEKAALPTASNTPPSPAKITKPECVVQETETTSKISCVLQKPDKNLDDIRFNLNHLSVDVKNEAGGRTRMDIIWEKAASPGNQQPASAQPSVAPTLP